MLKMARNTATRTCSPTTQRSLRYSQCCATECLVLLSCAALLWCVSLELIHHKDTENTEVAQRSVRALVTFVQSRSYVVTNIATAATAIITAVAQPSHLSSGEFVLSPITFLLLVSSTTRTISGGARTPFRTADQNSILTALMPR